jgi:hypothetical protein
MKICNFVPPHLYYDSKPFTLETSIIHHPIRDGIKDFSHDVQRSVSELKEQF